MVRPLSAGLTTLALLVLAAIMIPAATTAHADDDSRFRGSLRQDHRAYHRRLDNYRHDYNRYDNRRNRFNDDDRYGRGNNRVRSYRNYYRGSSRSRYNRFYNSRPGFSIGNGRSGFYFSF